VVSALAAGDKISYAKCCIAGQITQANEPAAQLLLSEYNTEEVNVFPRDVGGWFLPPQVLPSVSLPLPTGMSIVFREVWWLAVNQ